MYLSKSVVANHYDKIINKIVKTVKAIVDITMQYGCEELRADTSDAIEKVEVSPNGTW